MRLVLADAGPLYALIDSSDSHHRRAWEELDQLSQQGWQLGALWPNVLETHTLLQRKLGRGTSLGWLRDSQQSLARLNPTHDHFLEACRRVEALPDQAITLADATLAVVARELGTPIWTYDHHFDVLQAAVWRP